MRATEQCRLSMSTLIHTVVSCPRFSEGDGITCSVAEVISTLNKTKSKYLSKHKLNEYFVIELCHIMTGLCSKMLLVNVVS